METLRAAVNVTGAPKKKPCSGTCANESNYVDLGGTNTVKVTFTGEGNQRAIFKRQENREEHDELTEEGHPEKCKDVAAKKDPLSDDTSTEPEETNSDVMDLTNESGHESEEQDSTDMYLNSRYESESEDGDHSATETIMAEETETHYITTHEIQLTELDHDVDHELGRTASSCWDYEDDNLVYSFVDYASFKSDSTTERRTRHPPKPGISTESECYESDEGGRNTTGHIHVSIKSSSRTVNAVEAPSGENNARLHYSGEAGKITAPYDIRADCFIPAPGRQHLASKLKGKDVTEYSSGASSSVSELDDADKEVRNLTAKSFRSLACPYFDTIDLRPSSESSVSEHGLTMNKWSAFVDFDCRNYITQGGEHKNSTCSMVEMRKRTECQNRSALSEARTLQTSVATSKYTSVTCNARADLLTARERRAKCIRNGSTRAESSGEAPREPCGAMFASSLLQNVISKKMRFEQERKMERGEIRDAHPAQSPHRDAAGCKVAHVETSETESGHSVVSVEEIVDAMDAISREEEAEKEVALQSSSTPAAGVKPQEPQEGDAAMTKNAKESESEVTKVPIGSGATPVSAAPSELTEEKKEILTTNGKMTKMSHLYVPGSHFLPKDKDTTNGLSKRTMPSGVDTSKPPEIKIRLRSIKENKTEHQFNIASLLTPNLAKNTADPAKTHLSEKVPHFTVRDVRDSRCKLQTPIHQVRDVRKLVKSSYRFVPMDSGENKSGLFTLREEPDVSKKEPDKKDKADEKASPMPMVIKYQSVNTNSTNKQSNPESDRSSPKLGAKPQTLGEPQDIQMKTARWKLEKTGEGGDKRVECKLTNQAALEKLKAAVKTMEQLYVFDRNEWRRKTEAPRPVTDSHVLSLITSEEQAGDGERLVVNSGHPLFREMPKMPGSDTFKTSANTQPVSNVQDDVASSTKASFVQICPSKTETEERIGGEDDAVITRVTSSETQQRPVTDSENYLTIPIKPRPPEAKAQISDQSPTPNPQPRPPLQRSPVVTESWSPESPALMFQQALPAAQIVCVTPPTDSQAPNTQRKLLLDPMTGQCYLVDTPIALQPVTQRLYYPEGARYVDVPMPVALSPAAYVICPPAFVPPHSPSVSSEGDAASASVCATTGGAKPVISITSQQGPRIVAPPSFDGTTMSFVVEHR